MELESDLNAQISQWKGPNNNNNNKNNNNKEEKEEVNVKNMKINSSHWGSALYDYIKYPEKHKEDIYYKDDSLMVIKGNYHRYYLLDITNN